MSDLQARVSTDGKRLMCGRVSCHGFLGLVHSAWGLLSGITLPFGYRKGRDGVWALTNRARKNLARGRPAELARRPRDLTHGGMIVAGRKATLYEDPKMIVAILDLPAQVRCKVCDWINDVTTINNE